MATSLMVWLVLLVVAVYDARDNRIPNYLLLPLILLAGVQCFLVDGVSLLLSSMAAGGIFFSCGLVLYLLRAMSPGDVKLLGVVGMLVGWDAMAGAAYWITISAGVVGALFLLLHYAQHPDSLQKLVGRYSFQAMSGQVPLLSAYQSEVVQGKLTMPFAPAVVIGLALFHYF
ncbi:prepilin peptidase [Vibrio vulnificus]|uniref:prepilin peptidase n=1 Tax=Vibrio vulnificus TaxID=672 RepID=UPI00092954AF|nr:prepilin peptidase [Vibrio vulnificus]MDS1770481.1 prepilin peptidase [Vibrio vulnificus]MDS1851214.1 prepilin peptidase [Vibrio vulnificus]MDS1861557.1 prepilin peptidase [Vibrio vulnificus]OJI25469.1 Type IV leader peptidase family protein [Vibrio vulnificus]OJI49159.1 Type IV leader peptidase family protein [Vibrio vulnificus]